MSVTDLFHLIIVCLVCLFFIVGQFNMNYLSLMNETFMKMCDFQYCSVCLMTGVKMHSFSSKISSLAIVETYNKIMEIPLGIYKNSFCFECASLLAKYEEFRSKCYRAQSILSAIKTEDAEEIYKRIQNIDRKQNRLTSNLAPSPIKHHDNQAPIMTDDDTKLDSRIDVVDGIKIEDHDEMNEFSEDTIIDYEVHDVLKLESKIKIIKRKSNKVEVQIKRKALKKSNLTTEKESSSDDEPLSNKAIRNAELNKINLSDKIEDLTIPELKEISTIDKPRAGKKFKDLSEFDDYATVVFLTPEDARKEVFLRKETSNYINSPLKCDQCYRGYEAKVAFDNHMKKHSIEYGEYQCDICHLRFPLQRYLCKHRLASHKRKFFCKICPYVCFCMHQAKTHVSLHKGKKYPCKECSAVFSMPNSLLMHKRQKHPTECVCDICGHTFATTRGLYSHHMKLHRQNTNEKLGPKCEDCNKHFATEAAWKVHLVLSSKHNVSNGCKFCGDTFSSSQDLKSHMRVHARKHASRDIIKLPGLCSMCDKWLADRSEYRLHTSTAHPQSEAARKLDAVSPFVCEVCGKMFKKQCFLTYHQRKHSGSRPYECGECRKTFRLAGALATHRCHVCNRHFTFKSVLNKHMKVHLGIRPHRCDICDKSFISPCDVKIHIKYVHNKVPWPKRGRTKPTEPNYIQH